MYEAWFHIEFGIRPGRPRQAIFRTDTCVHAYTSIIILYTFSIHFYRHILDWQQDQWKHTCLSSYSQANGPCMPRPMPPRRTKGFDSTHARSFASLPAGSALDENWIEYCPGSYCQSKIRKLNFTGSLALMGRGGVAESRGEASIKIRGCTIIENLEHFITTLYIVVFLSEKLGI